MAESLPNLSLEQIQQIAAQLQIEPDLQNVVYETTDGTQELISKDNAIKVILARFKELAELDFNDARSWHEVIIEIQLQNKQQSEANVPLTRIKELEEKLYLAHKEKGVKPSLARLMARMEARSGGETAQAAATRNIKAETEILERQRRSEEAAPEIQKAEAAGEKFRSEQTAKELEKISERAKAGPITLREGPLTFFEKVVVPGAKEAWKGGPGELPTAQVGEPGQPPTPQETRIHGAPSETTSPKAAGEMTQPLALRPRDREKVVSQPLEKVGAVAAGTAAATERLTRSKRLKNFLEDRWSTVKIASRGLVDFFTSNGLPGWFALVGALVGPVILYPALGPVGAIVGGPPVGAGMGWLTGESLANQAGTGPRQSASQALPSGQAARSPNFLRGLANNFSRANKERQLLQGALATGARAAGSLLGGTSTATIAAVSISIALIVIAGFTILTVITYQTSMAQSPGATQQGEEKAFTLTKKPNITAINPSGGPLNGIKKVEYTVTISAKSDITVEDITDEALDYSGTNTPIPVPNNRPDEINNELISKVKGQKIAKDSQLSKSYWFEIDTDQFQKPDGTNSLSDSNLINTVTIIASLVSDPTKKETESIGATVKIGNPTETCPLAPDGNVCSIASLLPLPGVADVKPPNTPQAQAEKASRRCYAESVNGPAQCRCSLAPTGNLCYVENLRKYFGNDQTVLERASRICYWESGGVATKENLGCPNDVPGKYPKSYDIGLFQIGLYTWCKGAFKAGAPDTCSNNVLDQQVLDQCVADMKDPDKNIQKAVEIFNDRKGSFSAWTSSRRQYCNIP